MLKLTDPFLFPRAPTDRNPVIREKMAARGLADLYFFCKVILGYTALTPRAHGALCKFLTSVRWSRRMILMPRDHFKTTIATISNNIRRGILDTNNRILLISDTADNAQLMMQEIRNHFEQNQLLQWLYPDVIPDNFNKVRWNDSELELARTGYWKEPTFMAIGAYGGVESRHFNIITADDLVTEKHLRSDAEMDKLIKWMGGMEQLLTQDSDQIDFVGSRKKKGDAYEYVERYYGADRAQSKPIGPHAVRRGGLVVFSRSIVEDGKRIFPERVSWSYIIRVRTNEPERYHAQLANSPKGTGLNTFDSADLRYYTRKGSVLECWQSGILLHSVSIWSMDRIGLFDPSVAEKHRSSMNALGIIAKGSHPFRFLVSARVGHFNPTEAIQQLFEWDHEFQPQFWSIEKRGFQGSIKYWMEEKAQLENLPSPVVVEWPPTGAANAQWAKTEQIRGLQPIIRNNLLWIDPSFTEIMDEFEFYPNVRWDDGLDMLSQSLNYWPILEDDEAPRRRKDAEREFLERNLGFGSVSQAENWDEARFLASLDNTGYGYRRDYASR